MSRRTKRRKQLRASIDERAAAHAAAAGVQNRVVLGVVACFVLSGVSALLYQTAWMREFSIVFGTSELAVATVLSAYMAGLALGAAVAGRFVDRITRPVLAYGLLEAGIALSALSVPALLALSNRLYVGVLGGQPAPVDASGLGQSMFYVVVAFVVLAVPTGCMGATLPMLAKYVVRSEEQIGPRIGLLYALNTAGAVAGAVIAGFWLLPALGLTRTVWIGVAINASVFAIAALIARSVSAEKPPAIESARPQAAPPATRLASTAHGRRAWILPVMLLSGANTFAYEVLWTRLLGHVLGGSIAAFATMLAAFLSGIAVGSALGARFARDRATASTAFVVAQCGIALTSIVIFEVLQLSIPESLGLRGNALLAIVILLPATLFIGATFPLAVRILALDRADAAPASARVYAWNTVGAIFGAVVAGFILIPALRYEGAIHLAVTTNAALAVAVSFLLLRGAPRTTIPALAVLAAVGGAFWPQPPERVLRASPIAENRNGDIRYYEVGRSATVLILEEDGFLNLRTNGLPEASTNLEGAPPYQHNQRLLSTLPVLARPDVRDMLIVGFGAGVAVEGVPSSVEAIDVIELEPKVIEANRFISAERQTDPLADERVHIVVNDARSALALTSKRYDAIVSQPSHPWTAGASHLYTREFMTIAKDHLNPGGVFLQWMNTQFVTESLLKSLCATLLDVYRYGRVYQWDPEVLFFLGSDEPLDVERQLAMTGRPITDDPTHYLEKGVGSVEDLLVALAMDQERMERFAGNAAVLTDDFNRMATESATAMERGDTITLRRLIDLVVPYDPLFDPQSWVYSSFPGDLKFGYIAERLERKGFKKHAVELANALESVNPPESLLLIGMGLERQGQDVESQRVLLSAHLQDPTNSQIRFALLRPWLNRLARGDAPEYVSKIAATTTGSEAAVLAAWQAASAENWQAVVGLDSSLARARPTDQWYLEAVKLRADWRIKVTTPEYQPRLAREAMRLIDNAIAIFQDPEFYSMRVAAAFVADDALDVVETARRLMYIFNVEANRAVEGVVTPTAEAIALKLRQIEAVRTVVDRVKSDHDIPPYKTEQLDRSLSDIIRRLETLRTAELERGEAP